MFVSDDRLKSRIKISLVIKQHNIFVIGLKIEIADQPLHKGKERKLS